MKKPSQILAFIMLAFLASTSHAIPTAVTTPCVNETSLSCLIGINNLEFSGNSFNVLFSQGSYTNTFSSVDPLFLGDWENAGLADAAIRQFLQTAGMYPIGFPGAGGGFIAVPYLVVTPEEYDEPMETLVHSYATIINRPLQFHAELKSTSPSHVLADDIADGLYNSYAVITRAVPAPATLALLALGLAGVGIHHRTLYRSS